MDWIGLEELSSKQTEKGKKGNRGKEKKKRRKEEKKKRRKEEKKQRRKEKRKEWKDCLDKFKFKFYRG